MTLEIHSLVDGSIEVTFDGKAYELAGALALMAEQDPVVSLAVKTAADHIRENEGETVGQYN